MAEYNEVIKQFKRMCKSISPVKCTRGECLMGCENIGQCRKVAFERPVEFEQKVMQWAAEHPEPKYQTWVEWLSEQGLVGCRPGLRNDEMEYCLNSKVFYTIPADIAQKIGIEPKEG